MKDNFNNLKKKGYDFINDRKSNYIYLENFSPQYLLPLKKALTTTGILTSCINSIARESSSIKINLINNKKKENVTYEDNKTNKLLNILYTPNDHSTFESFRQLIFGDMALFGNAYFLKDKYLGSLPTELRRLDPCYVTKNINKETGNIVSYTYSKSGKNITYKKEVIIPVMNGYNPYNQYYGLPALFSTLIDNDTIIEAKEYNKSFFENSAVPQGLLVAQGKLNDKETAKIHNAWQSMFHGIKKAFRFGVMGENIKYTKIGTDHKDIGFSELLDFSEKNIQQTYGIPPIYLGIYEESRYNTQEQKKLFYEQTLIPYMDIFLASLNTFLVPDFYKKEDFGLVADYSDKQFLKNDPNQTADAFVKYNGAGVPKNDIIDLLDIGLTKYPEWDTPSSPFDLVGGLNISKYGVKTIVKKGQKQFSRETARKKQEDIFKTSEPYQEEDKNNTSSHWERQYNHIDNIISDIPIEELSYSKIFDNKIQADLLFSVKKNNYTDMFKASLEVERQYLRKFLNKKNLRYDKKGTEERIEKWIKNNVFAWALQIEKTTAKQIDLIILNAVEQGEGTTFLNARLREYFTSQDPALKGTAYYRLNIISTTEMLGISSESALEAYRAEDGVTHKEWITSTNIATEHHEGHLELDGQIVEKNKSFINSITGQQAQAPRQFGEGSQDIHCLCDIAPVVQD